MPKRGGGRGGGSGSGGASGKPVPVKRVMDGVDCSEIVSDFLYMSSIRASADRDALKAIGITHIVNVAGAQKFPSEFAYFRCYAPDSAESNLLEKFDSMREFIDSAAHGTKPGKGKTAATATAAATDDDATATATSDSAADASANGGDGDGGANDSDTKSKPAARGGRKAAAAAAGKVSRNTFAASQAAPKSKVLIHCRGGISRSATLTIAYLMSIAHPQCDTVLNALAFVRTKRPTVRPNANFMKQLHDFEHELAIKTALTAVVKRLAVVPAIVQIICVYTVVPTATITRAGEADDD